MLFDVLKLRVCEKNCSMLKVKIVHFRYQTRYYIIIMVLIVVLTIISLQHVHLNYTVFLYVFYVEYLGEPCKLLKVRCA